MLWLIKRLYSVDELLPRSKDEAQKWDVIGDGLVSVLDVQSLLFLLMKIACDQHHANNTINIMLIIYYCQEIFLLTLTSDSEAIP